MQGPSIIDSELKLIKIFAVNSLNMLNIALWHLTVPSEVTIVMSFEDSLWNNAFKTFATCLLHLNLVLSTLGIDSMSVEPWFPLE